LTTRQLCQFPWYMLHMTTIPIIESALQRQARTERHTHHPAK
jgi:hypothetical protein